MAKQGFILTRVFCRHCGFNKVPEVPSVKDLKEDVFKSGEEWHDRKMPDCQLRQLVVAYSQVMYEPMPFKTSGAPDGSELLPYDPTGKE